MRSNLVYITKLSLVGLLSLGAYFMGTSILENAHLMYIRYEARKIVTLLNYKGGGGTGFLVKGKSGMIYILTNQHICRSAEGKPLTAIYRNDKYLVKVIKSYQRNDLCAVEAPGTAKEYFRVANSVVQGERVYSIGHPLLEPITMTQGELSSDVSIEIPVAMNVTPAECSGETYRIEEADPEDLFAKIFGMKNICIRTLECNGSTVNILPGNSGSPTVNIWGNIVGVVFAATSGGIHSYHVPLSFVKEFLGEL